jgi:transcriptional regulator with XRE-family HTH domain
MLTRSEFVMWLDVRRSAGESLTAIGRDLGVSRQAVQQWLNGATQPSRMALMLAEQTCRAPLEMASGLPVAAGRERGH